MDKARKTEIIQKFGRHEGDTGSPEVQVALLTERMECAEAGVINDLNGIPRVVWARSV